MEGLPPRQEQPDENEEDFDIPPGRYKEGWDEDKWEKQFEEHPFFMTQNPDGELPPLVEALQQLKYDPEENTKVELATNYKEDGNANFKLKKYRWAVEAYTAGIKQNCEDDKLNSQLHGNRSAAHFHLKNYKSALMDCLKAIELDPENVKAALRAADCYMMLEKFGDCVEYCRRHKSKYPKLEELEKKAFDQKKVGDRNARRREAQERKLEAVRVKIEEAVSSRGIKTKGSLFDPLHPAASGRHVVLNETSELTWPVVFIYPEYGQTDFIESFNENTSFVDLFKEMFDRESPPWDKERKYSSRTIVAGFQSLGSEELITFSTKSSLGKVLSSPEFVVLNGIPTFILTCVKKENVVGVHVRKKVEVSLGDCLACSGCITSAETVLIAKQSHKELINVLKTNKEDPSKAKVVIISFSHQSIASMAAKHSLDFQEAAEKLCAFFVDLGCSYVFDLTIARHFSLLESLKEFYENETGKSKLTSVCPGFVCYVEKTHGELLVPLLSRVKSPQQVMGSIVKHLWRKDVRIEKPVYHVTVMPCYDKKLEASRNEFASEDHHHDVDCVLTPLEIEELLELNGSDLASLTPRKLDQLFPEISSGTIETHLGSGSGGYVENVYRAAVYTMFREKIEDTAKLNYKVRRNKDFLELDFIEKESGKQLLSFAVVNGFRNIQTLVQKIKRKTCKYNFIEVMACPSGCLNGGGQLRGSSVEDKLLPKIEELYRSLRVLDLPIDPNHEVNKKLYQKWFPTERDVLTYLHTTFKPLPKTTVGFNVAW